nr:NAD(P)-dependent oxidoreductase [Vagococcus allomyrinae]
MKKVLVTGIVSKAGLAELEKKCEVTYSEIPFKRSWVLEHLSEYDGVILMGMTADKEFIEAGKNLAIISVNGVGFDHVDLTAAAEQGITVSNSPQSVRVATAELTFSLILAAAKRLHEYDSIVRSGSWVDVSEERYQGLTLDQKTLGVYGFGRIGQTVAKYADAFGMKIIYHDHVKLPEKVEKATNATYVEFDTMLSEADVITIHAPLLESTRGIFNEETFKKMKSSAYLVNAARGPIVSEAALVSALKHHEIAGAGLDVFENEPRVSEALRTLPTVIMAPHAGTGTVAGRQEIATEAAANIISFFEGKPVNVVSH